MSDEIALALANFCRASLDSAAGTDTSGFRRLGNLRHIVSTVIKTATNQITDYWISTLFRQTNLSPIGWMLEMVTSLSLGSSFSRAQEENDDPPSLSHRDPKLSPDVNGLSLYLRSQWMIQIRQMHTHTQTLSTTNILWRSRGKARLIKHVQLRARGGFGSHRGLLLDHLHLRHHGMRHGTTENQGQSQMNVTIKWTSH